MAYRNKTYVCFDGDNDINYYWLMKAWSEHKKIDFDFYDAHDLNTARDSSQEESIKKQLRERFANSKLLVVLIGQKTKLLTKFVRWEMEVALRLDLPIVGVNLNGSRDQDSLCPPTIKDRLSIYVPFNLAIIKYAMEHWPARHSELKLKGELGPRSYKSSIYEQLGLG